MKTVTMLPMFLLAMHQMRYSEYLTRINQPIQQLLNTTKFSDVQLLVHDSYNNKSEVIDEIYKTVVGILPTTYIFINNSIPAKLPFMYASRKTLMLFIYFSNNCPNFQQSKNIVDIITYNNNTLKVLLMTILEEENCNFLSFFEQIWKKFFLDVMILEVPEFSENQSAIMIHQYNPYTQIYDRQPYTSSVEWFPNKSRNLYGYPIRAFMFARSSTLILDTDSQGNITIDGLDAKTMDAIAQTLNATPNLIFVDHRKSTADGFVRKNDVHIFMISLPIFKKFVSDDIEYTLPLISESLCPLVPIFRQVESFITRTITGIAVNIIVVLIVWRISVILRFDKKFWGPLAIFSILISASVSMKPKGLIEKTMILILDLLSSIYSTNLYADLTTTTLQGSFETVYKDFKELNDSGLVPMIYYALFNITFVNHDPYLAALKKKALITMAGPDCADYAVKYKNVTCFMEHKAAEMIIYSHLRKGENVLTICENLCYANPPTAYYVRKNLPYIDQINDIRIRLQAAGFFDKWNADVMGKISVRREHLINIEEQEESSLVSSLIAIGGCGCAFSFLVFCAEIIINRFEKKKKK